MKNSVVIQCLTRTFTKSEVLTETKDIYKNISHSRVRFFVLTGLIVLGDESLDNVAHCFAKQGTEVSNKFHIQFFSNQEAARLSWKCVNLFTHVTEKEQKTVELRAKQLGKTLVPSPEKIGKWCEEYKNSLNLKCGDVTNS